MRIGVISDVHANLEALEAVAEVLRDSAIDRCVCLGDIVGYGANPNETIEIVRGLTEAVVIGNHDQGVLGLADTSNFNSYAQAAILWTARQISSENRDYLEGLPYVIRDGRYAFVHSSLDRPEEWGYVFSSWQAQVCLHYVGAGQICLIGHSHRPLVFDEREELLCSGGVCNVSFDPSLKYLVNVGSVGQPRDSDARAAFCILDEDESTVEIVRVEYDIAAAQRKIRDAGLPPFLADRLSRGA